MLWLQKIENDINSLKYITYIQTTYQPLTCVGFLVVCFEIRGKGESSGAYLELSRTSTVTYFRKKLNRRCLTGF